MFDAEELRDILSDSGWEGPDIVYLMCRRHSPRNGTNDEPEFIAKVTPDPIRSIQRWRMSCFILFTQTPGVGKSLYYDVKEISVVEAETHIAFGTFPVYDVHGSNMMGFD